MSTFYLLPPRPYVADCLASYLASWLPGLQLPGWKELADAVDALAARADVFIVHREDLPDGEEPGRALLDGFGAEPGDEVIEVRAGGRPGEVVARRWRIGRPVAA